MARISCSCVFALLLLLIAGSCSTHAASCIGYSKGDFTGDVTSKDICETACEVAEGLPKPDFKMQECTTDNSTVTLYECACRRENNNGVTTQSRGLCDDGVCEGEVTGGASPKMRTVGFTIATSVLAVGLLM